MAEDMEEITVTGTNLLRQPKKPLSAWKAALLGLPGGPLVSLGFGLAQHFRNKSYLEDEARRQLQTRDEKAQLQATLESESSLADPDEKRLIDYLKGRVSLGYQRLASGDKTGADMISHAEELLEGLIGKDMQARKEEAAKQKDFQRTLVSDAAKSYRQEYQNTLSEHNAIRSTAQQVLALVSDTEFDPNKPANKAMLAELLSMGAAMFKDTPDALEGIAQGVGAFNSIAGGVASGIATIVKSEDFKMSPEDYNRLALNSIKYADAYAKQKATQVMSQAGALNKWGQDVGALEKDYSLANYITGGEKELRLVPNPEFTGGYKASEEQQAAEARKREVATQTLLNIQRYGNPYGNPRGARGATGIWGQPRRPTN